MPKMNTGIMPWCGAPNKLCILMCLEGGKAEKILKKNVAQSREHRKQNSFKRK
jgi:hypothetical protein